MTPASVDPRELARTLNPLIQAEIASIGAIEGATTRQEEPAYVFLYQATKTAKQANVEQMTTLLRMAGVRPAEGGGLFEPVLKMQAALMQKVSTTATLKAMRLVEERLVAEYRALIGRLDETALEGRAAKRVMERAVKHWHVLTAHIAKRENDRDEASRLPHALSAYFANAEAKACMRCHFDRAGSEPPVEKTDPHPYTYVCAACYAEVLADFPPDLLEQAMRWPDEVRRDRVVERALGRPETLRATQGVVALLSGLEPEEPEVRRSGVKQVPRARVTIAPPATREAPVVDLPRHNASASELAYTDLLFDFASVRRNW